MHRVGAARQDDDLGVDAADALLRPCAWACACATMVGGEGESVAVAVGCGSRVAAVTAAAACGSCGGCRAAWGLRHWTAADGTRQCALAQSAARLGLGRRRRLRALTMLASPGSISDSTPISRMRLQMSMLYWLRRERRSKEAAQQDERRRQQQEGVSWRGWWGACNSKGPDQDLPKSMTATTECSSGCPDASRCFLALSVPFAVAAPFAAPLAGDMLKRV